MSEYDIVLASASPRRRELLAQTGVEFRVHAVDADESLDERLAADPVEAVNAVAAALSDGDAANGEADLILASYHEGAQVSLKANDPQETQAAALQTAMSTSPTFRSIVEDTAPEVDAILNGHTHNLYSWLAPAPAGSLAVVLAIECIYCVL